MFREWLSKGKNYQDTESHMTFLREKEVKGKREWECLTILEMVKRNLSMHGAEQSCHARLCMCGCRTVLLMTIYFKQ